MSPVFVNERTLRRIKACWTFVLVWMVLSGCAPTYRAPELPTSEVATVTAGSDELAVIAVDDVRISRRPQGGAREVTVAPGQHTITVRRTKNGYVAEGPLTVDFESGARYILRSTSQGYGVSFWLEKQPAEPGCLI